MEISIINDGLENVYQVIDESDNVVAFTEDARIGYI